MEIIEKFLRVIAGIGGLIFGTPEFKKLKIIISFLSIIFSLLLIWYWIYLERKYKFGIDEWKRVLRDFSDAFLKEDHFKKQWADIKKIFLVNHLKAINRTYKFLQELIDFYGYKGDNIIEKFKNFPDQILKNKSDFLKAVEILVLIDNKQKKKEGVEISKDEALRVLYEIEKGLKNLLVINHEDLWVEELIPPLER
ncbi:MAG: hypothetical protein ACP5JU_01610 [Minisyncoccia bacterium]